MFRKPWGFPISGERSFRYKPYSHAGRSYERYVVFIKISQEIRSQRISLVPRLLTAANCLNRKNLSPCFCTLRALRVRPHSACTILSTHAPFFHCYARHARRYTVPTRLFGDRSHHYVRITRHGISPWRGSPRNEAHEPPEWPSRKAGFGIGVFVLKAVRPSHFWWTQLSL